MRLSGGTTIRRLLPLAAMVLGSACGLETIGGPAPAPQVIVVTATAGGAHPDEPAPSPTIGSVLDLPTVWTTTPQSTNTAMVAATVTGTSVTMTAGQNLSCVKGPHWVLYGWVAGIKKGETVVLLARSTPDWPDYFYVRTSDGKECWAFGGSSTINGDASGLPEREAPPLPSIKYAIENKNHLPVCDVFLRGKDESVWGADRLGAGTIAPGVKFELTITAGFYDVLMRDCTGGILFTIEDKPIGSDAASHYTAVETPVTFSIANGTALMICQIGAHPADGSAEFNLRGPTDAAIAPGGNASVTAPAGIYDLHVYSCGDPSPFLILTDTYIGPAMAGITLL